jgi:hypothetical protein
MMRSDERSPEDALSSSGVRELPLETVALLQAVRSFNDFTTDNDPRGEHDSGSVDLMGQTFFFKVDYYSPDMQGGSENPADPEQTTRVLTIMRADEYGPAVRGSFLFSL